MWGFKEPLPKMGASRRNCWLLVGWCGVLLGLPLDVLGQGSVGVGDRAAGTPADYNLRVGSLQLDLSAYSSVTYDSNFERTDDAASGSASFVQGLRNRLLWTPHPVFSVDAQLDISYTQRTGPSSAFDGLQIRGGPDSGNAAISADLRLGDTTIRNAFEYTQSLQEGRIATGAGSEENANFEQSTWALSTRYRTQLTPYTGLSAGYRFQQSRSASDDFEELERDQHTFNVSVNTRLNPQMDIGAYANTTLSRSSSEDRSDTNAYAFGVSHRWVSSWQTTLTTRAGLRVTQIAGAGLNDRAEGGLTPQVSTALTWQGPHGRQHRLSLSFSEQDANLVAGNSGVTVDSRQRVLQSAYGFQAKLRPAWAVSFNAGLNQTWADGSGVRRNLQLGLNTGYALGPNWRVSLGHRYTHQFEGGSRGGAYSRHRSRLSLVYDF